MNTAALAEYRRAEALLGPVHPMVQNGAARVLLELGEYDAVLESLREASNWFPGYYPSYVHRSSAYNHLQRYDEALEEAEQAMGINPFDPRVHEERIRALEGLGQSGALLQALEMLQQLQP